MIIAYFSREIKRFPSKNFTKIQICTSKHNTLIFIVHFYYNKYVSYIIFYLMFNILYLKNTDDFFARQKTKNSPVSGEFSFISIKVFICLPSVLSPVYYCIRQLFYMLLRIRRRLSIESHQRTRILF